MMKASHCSQKARYRFENYLNMAEHRQSNFMCLKCYVSIRKYPLVDINSNVVYLT